MLERHEPGRSAHEAFELGVCAAGRDPTRFAGFAREACGAGERGPEVWAGGRDPPRQCPELPPGRLVRSVAGIGQRGVPAESRPVELVRSVVGIGQRLPRLLAGVTRTLREADQGAAAWISRFIPAAYQAGMDQAKLHLGLQGMHLTPPDKLTGIHLGAVREVAKDTMQDLLAATQRVEESVKASVRKVAREEIMTQVATGKRASGKRIAERMAEQGVYGVQDKRGRFIPMEEYARMVSHVKLRETHAKGMEGLIQVHGFDLVQISHHVHKPDICAPLEGKVYSLTGNTPGWPKLPRHTPFHVGCRHVETPFIDTFLSDEKIAELQDLSNASAPVYTYTPEQLARADAKRAQRERGRKARKERERKNAAAVASGKKKPVQAVREEILADRAFPQSIAGGGRLIEFRGSSREEPGRETVQVRSGADVVIEGAKSRTTPVDEKKIVRNALRRVPSHHFAGDASRNIPPLDLVKITHNQIVTHIGGQQYEANGVYLWEARQVVLGRQYRFLVGEVNEKATTEIVLHEVGHHWFTYASPGAGAKVMERFAQDQGLTVAGIPQRNVQEFYAFAYQMFYTKRRELRAASPDLYQNMVRWTR